MADLQAVQFQAPPVNPAPSGLYAAIDWVQDGNGPLRFLPAGVEVEPFNYGAEAGVWGAAWCAAEDDLTPQDVKDGVRDRPAYPGAYEAIVTYGWDECLPRDREQIRNRAAQNQRLLEPLSVEAFVAARLLADVSGDELPATTIVEAVGLLDAAIAQTGVAGVVHAAPQWAAPAAEANLLVRSGAAVVTPMGNRWVFGGGYVTGLTDTLVATSAPFGWRGPQMVQPSIKMEHNRYVALAERAVVVAWEQTIAAATIG